MKKRYLLGITISTVLILMLTGCSGSKKEPIGFIKKLKPSDYPEFVDDMAFNGLEQSIIQSLSYLKRIPPDRAFQFGEDQFNAEHIIRTMEHFQKFIQQRPTKKGIKTLYRVKLSGL